MAENIAQTPPETLPLMKGLTFMALMIALGVLAAAVGGAVGAFPPVAGWFNPLYSIAGLLVGILVGLTGVGGGSLMTPVLVLLFGFHPNTAVGTDLLYASLTKSVGAAVHGANRTIDWRVTRRMALGSIPATAATVGLLYVLHQQHDSGSKLITTMLGFALLLTAVALLFRTRLFDFAQRHSLSLGPRATAIGTVVLGAAMGVLITLSSVGAGAIGVTVLIFLYPKMPVARIVGSDIAHAVPLTMIAGLGHWFLGSVNVALLGSLLVGSIPGIIIGGQLTPKIPERFLRPVVAVTLLLVGAKFVF